MPRYKKGHIRKTKIVKAIRKSRRCNICGLTIVKGSPAYARNPHFLGSTREYEHARILPGIDAAIDLQACPKTIEIYGRTMNGTETVIYLEHRYVLDRRGHRVIVDENMNAI